MNIGETIRLKNGCIATIWKIGTGDFFGDPFPVYIVYTSKDNTIKYDIIMSNEMQKRDGQEKHPT